MCWKTDFVDLCYCCVSDPSTLGNMRNIVIPAIQAEAVRYREAADALPSVWLIRQELDTEATRLERAVSNARLRCQQQPVQQQLFAA